MPNSTTSTPETHYTDIAIIGAGPAGSIAAALLREKNYRVTILEQQHFPRFSIGESLLPQCMQFIEQAGLLEAVKEAQFHFKNGAAFAKVSEGSNSYSEFDFSEKFSDGPGTTFQVVRADFDKVLARGAAEKGADIRFGHRVTGISTTASDATLCVSTDKDDHYTLKARYLLDASGFGRVLPRLLDLEVPSTFPSRTSLFTHIEDNISANTQASPGSSDYFDREKILISVHPTNQDVWYWLIPFGNGRCSIGVVAENAFFEPYATLDPKLRLQTIIDLAPNLKSLLKDAVFDTDARQITGYACDVKSLHGDSFALLGNAGEFLDPVFSSGVTIAMKSASLIAPLVDRHLLGDSVDWQKEYSEPLKLGVNTFRTYVNAWYDGRFQTVIFSRNQSASVRAMISSILAGYAWDQQNPLVAKSETRLNAIVALCENR